MFFKLQQPPFSWGDYGDILVNGMTHHLGPIDGQLQLERTGSFVPPISFPGLGAIIIADSTRKMLEQSDLSGFDIKRVIKTRVGFLEWEKWDWTLAEAPI